MAKKRKSGKAAATGKAVFIPSFRVVPTTDLPVPVRPGESVRLVYNAAAGRWVQAHAERPHDGEPDECRDLAAASKA